MGFVVVLIYLGLMFFFKIFFNNNYKLIEHLPNMEIVTIIIFNIVIVHLGIVFAQTNISFRYVFVLSCMFSKKNSQGDHRI